MNDQRNLMLTTANGAKVYVEPGTKSRWDFRVSHSRTEDTPYTVFHRDFVREVYQRRAVQPLITDQLIDHFICIIKNARGVTSFPPSLVQFRQEQVEHFRNMGLKDISKYDIELLLVLFELVQIQEETNYPNGWVPTKLWTTIKNEGDNLEEVAYLTEVVVPKRENPVTLAARDNLLCELTEIMGKSILKSEK